MSEANLGIDRERYKRIDEDDEVCAELGLIVYSKVGEPGSGMVQHRDNGLVSYFDNEREKYLIIESFREGWCINLGNVKSKILEVLDAHVNP